MQTNSDKTNCSYLAEIFHNDETLGRELQKIKEDKSITREEAYQRVRDFLAKKDMVVTNEDLDEYLKNDRNAIFERELSEDELSAVSGGITCMGSQIKCHNGAGSDSYPEPSCKATVEANSWCGSNDMCYEWDIEYTWHKKY